MSKKQFSSVTQIVDEVGVISPFFFLSTSTEMRHKRCDSGDRRCIPRIWLSAWRYINIPVALC